VGETIVKYVQNVNTVDIMHRLKAVTELGRT